jgi:hypothetical protein
MLPRRGTSAVWSGLVSLLSGRGSHSRSGTAVVGCGAFSVMVGAQFHLVETGLMAVILT